jgi:hypothetical protein
MTVGQCNSGILITGPPEEAVRRIVLGLPVLKILGAPCP